MKNWKCFAAAAIVICMGAAVGCGSTKMAKEGGSTTVGNQTITVVSREDGSGTRGAFIELFGIEEKDLSGKKTDNTTDDATITNSTEVMMTTIAGDTAAIGYTSLGALNPTVKALKIDGAEATAANVKNGTYKISRPFNIAVKGDISDITQDFINFILSDDGQKIVEERGYISQGSRGAFITNGAAGKIVVAGSSSVTPVMEKLLEVYSNINKAAKTELQESDSTTGMTNTIAGTCDIGMASRELKDSEREAGLSSQVIAMDGIAVIVNNDNNISDITSEQVKEIFKGEISDWSNVN